MKKKLQNCFFVVVTLACLGDFSLDEMTVSQFGDRERQVVWNFDVAKLRPGVWWIGISISLVPFSTSFSNLIIGDVELHSIGVAAHINHPFLRDRAIQKSTLSLRHYPLIVNNCEIVYECCQKVVNLNVFLVATPYHHRRQRLMEKQHQLCRERR